MDTKQPDNKEVEKKDYSYVVLAECSGKEYETWYSFIRVEGNEEALAHLDKQLRSIEFYIIDDLSTFDLDMDHKFCAKTAKEMTKLEVNSKMFHKKFDGKLKMIDLGLSKKDSNDKKILKVFNKLGIGRIDKYIDGEDIDPEDMVSSDDENKNSGDESSEYEYSIDSESESSSSDSEREKHRSKKDKLNQTMIDKIKRKQREAKEKERERQEGLDQQREKNRENRERQQEKSKKK